MNDTAAASTRTHPAHQRRPDGFFTRWKKILGLDAFMATASDATHGTMRDRTANPFNRGVVGNCRDFWCDPAPIFGQRKSGEGYLGGQVVDYAHMYEVPLRLRRHVDGMAYASVPTAADDDDTEP